MQTVTVTCDTCEKDLSKSKTTDYMIHLTASSLPYQDVFIQAVYIKPPIDRGYHFCGLECLKEWVNK